MMGIVLVLGLVAVVILFATELLARGLWGVATKANLPGSVVHNAVLPLAYSLPAVIILLNAGQNGSPVIGLASAIGGFSLQSLLMIGALALIHPMPALSSRRLVLGLMVLSLAFYACFSDRWLSRMEAMALSLAVLIVLLIGRWRSNSPPLPVEKPRKSICTTCAWAYLLLGCGLLFTGSDMTVDAIAAAARALHMHEARAGALFGGLIISLPCGWYAAKMAYRRQAERALYTILIGNFAILAGLAWAHVNHSLPVSPAFSPHYALLFLISIAYIGAGALRGAIGAYLGALGLALWLLLAI